MFFCWFFLYRSRNRRKKSSSRLQNAAASRNFVQKFEKELSNTATLKSPTGELWCIGLKKAAGQVLLEHGWPEFIEHLSLCSGNELTLNYMGNSFFEVLISGKTSCEIGSKDAPKEPEMSDSIKNSEDLDYRSDESLEILEESLFRSHGPSDNPKPESNKQINRSEKLLIKPKFSNSKQRGNVLEPRQSIQFQSEKLDIPRVPKSHQEVELKHHKLNESNKDAKGSFHHEVYKCISMDRTENRNQQHSKKQDGGVAQHSVHLMSGRSGGKDARGCGHATTTESTVESSFVLVDSSSQHEDFTSKNEVAEDNLWQPNERCNVNVPRCSKRLNSIQSDGKVLDGYPSSEECSISAENQRDESDEETSPRTADYSQECGSVRFITRRKPVTHEERWRALAEARKFVSQNPFFLVVMKPTHVYKVHYVHIPLQFAKKYIPIEEKIVFLEDSDKRKWPVRCYRRPTGTGLSKGWAQFVWENNLEEGDVCIFELVNRETTEFEVSIFQVFEEVTPFIKYTKKKNGRKDTCN